AARARRRVDQRHGGEPLLCAPPAAARPVPALGRLSAAGGSARGRRAAARGGARDEARAAGNGRRVVGLVVPPGVDPARRPGLPARRLVRRGGARAHGALLSRAAGRRARRPPARAQAPLPHLQRLHDRAAQGARVGLLSARSLLSRAARARGARGRKTGRRTMSDAGGTLAAAWARLRPGRSVHGIAAALLPYTSDGRMDLAAFEAHVARTHAAGLDVAVNMDTGFGDLLAPAEREAVLDATRRALGPGPGFYAGAFALGAADPLAAYRESIAAIERRG